MSQLPPLIFIVDEKKITVERSIEEFREIQWILGNLRIPLNIDGLGQPSPMLFKLADSVTEFASLKSESAFVKQDETLNKIGVFPDHWGPAGWCYRDASPYPALAHFGKLDSSWLLYLSISNTRNNAYEQYFGHKVFRPGDRTPGEEAGRCAMFQFRFILSGYVKELLLEKPGVFHALFNVLRYGFYPLTWRGPFPEGYCLAVHLPFDQPAPPVPPECQPSPEILKKYAKPPKHPKPMAIAAPDVPPLPASAWNALIARARAPGGAAAVFREHFAVLAETDACRVVLDRIAAVVTGLRKDGRDLIVEFPAQTYGTTHDGEPMAPASRRFLRCPPPFMGAFVGLPPSCAAVIRQHNGMTMQCGTDSHEFRTVFGWHVYKKPRFQFQVDDWFSPDEWDPDELFMTVPQVPIFGENSIWLLHPQRLRAANEPELVRMSGTLCNPLPYGAGGVFLRLLALYLDVEGGDGDLWDDGR